jgi:hypothetical protein
VGNLGHGGLELERPAVSLFMTPGTYLCRGLVETCLAGRGSIEHDRLGKIVRSRAVTAFALDTVANVEAEVKALGAVTGAGYMAP